MSILASLVRAYDRLPDKPAIGYSAEKIGFLVSLNADGTVAHVIDLRTGDGKKKTPRILVVPQAVKRASGIASNFLWDKTSYVLGVTAGEGKRLAAEHAAFVERHSNALQGHSDEGLRALMRFLESWSSDQFVAPTWPDEMKDQNVAFCLENERLNGTMLHDRAAARDLWTVLSNSDDRDGQICLVTGDAGPVARLHPSIKGVWGGQSSGGAIVSFNLDAFESYGHEQGDNAQVSEIAAFKYTTALNRYLGNDSGHRIQIGDASTVFWADASDAALAGEAESIFAQMMEPNEKEADKVKDIADKLKQIHDGVPLSKIEPELDGVRFFVLGLAPNAARISIRFYCEDRFGALTRNYQQFLQDMSFEPWPKDRKLSISSSVLRTSPARIEAKKVKFDRDQVSPLLAGELFRSILTGSRFPGTLLSLLLLRVRSDHVLDSIRIALIKGVIARNARLEKRLPKRPDGTMMENYLMRSDPNDPNPARRAGRLFAIIERAQLASLGDNVNSTVKDKFLGAAAATPQRVFPRLLENAERHHIKRLRNGHSDADWIKDADHARGVGAALARDMGRLAATFGDGWPQQHSSEEQGLFLIGYYQERYGSKSDGTAPEDQPNRNEIDNTAEEDFT